MRNALNSDEEYLVVEPDSVPEQCHACINALYEELLHREGVQSKHVTLLERLNKLSIARKPYNLS